MKKVYLYITLIAFVFIGCEDELNLEPFQSISTDVALGSEDNIANILVGAYDEAGQAATYGGRTHMMAELLGASGEISWNGTFLDPRQIFTKSILVDNGFVDGHWGNSYAVINQVNLVIDNIAIVTSSTDERNRIEGEAKFLRALTYFDLIRLFADPYQAGGGNTQLGVPLRTEGIVDFGVDLSIARSSVEEVYTQIISDLNDAVSLLPATNGFFADQYAARALQARVYFQQGNYAAARDAANDVLMNSGHSLTTTFAEAFNNDTDSSEDIFAFQVTSQTGTNQLIIFYASEGNGGRGGDIGIEAPYLALFDDPGNDVRASFNYVSPNNGELLTSKYTNQFGNVPTIRVAEMHLIRAESNFREGTAVGLDPLLEINTLRGRSNAAPLGVLTLDALFNERRLELGFEGHLIHDYKRTGRSVGAIPATDDSLVFPIPQSEMDTNPLMVQNSGY
jgi:hypothetical protein